MASSTTTIAATANTLQQKQIFSISHCKYPATLNLNTFKFQFLSEVLTSLPPKHTLKLKSSPIFVLHKTQARLHTSREHENPSKTLHSRSVRETSSGFKDKRDVENTVEAVFSSLVRDKSERRFIKDTSVRKDVGFKQRRENSSLRSRDGYKPFKNSRNVALERVERKPHMGNGGDKNQVMEETKMGKKFKSKKVETPAPWVELKLKLDMCSKKGDVMGAIEIFDRAQREGIKLKQYHYTVLLYLCSSAAVGVVRPNKSGSGSRTLNALDFAPVVSCGVNSTDSDVSRSDEDEKNSGARRLGDPPVLKNEPLNDPELKVDSNMNIGKNVQQNKEIVISDDLKNYALEKGFEIYEKMCLDKVPMNEATLTAVARLAMSMGKGDMAFDMVKQMKALGINPRLRSYGPALSTFCSSGDVDKAFEVEKHMLEHGVYPEEPELQALLKVSIEAGKGDKVYYLLHKLRKSLRKVSPSTADIITVWFKSKEALKVGKAKWDQRLIQAAIKNGGGGWHGQGWLGKGKWTISHSIVGSDALCKCCGEKLSIIDLDPVETENFAKSVASIACNRERNSNFQKFQKWLDYYGPFEAVIDAANVGLFSQKKFVPSKVNVIANAIRQKLPSKKLPLIVLHNRRITGDKMEKPINKSLIEKWKTADALYATPSGSNDDWYWLYAAIKFKCLIVTNDEMRDHIFQLLGNDFFPRWKERHQVRFGFADSGPVFHMPPPCSIVIQESENGHWHIPIASEDSEEDHGLERTWLCITRANTSIQRKDSTSQLEDQNGAHTGSSTQSEAKIEPQPMNKRYEESTPKSPQEIYRNLTNILSESVCSDHNGTVLSKLDDAERLGNCVIDFQI